MLLIEHEEIILIILQCMGTITLTGNVHSSWLGVSQSHCGTSGRLSFPASAVVRPDQVILLRSHGSHMGHMFPLGLFIKFPWIFSMF